MKIIILTLMIFICFSQIAYAERPMNEIPMYGGQHKPMVPENIENSEGAAKLGWEYFYKGDLDTAIKRFNQAWMFDRNSADAFWGFGVIMGHRAYTEDVEKNIKESVRFLEKANSLSKNNARIMVDLAYSETLLASLLEEENKSGFQKHYDKARKLFKKAEKLENDYPLVYANWSILEFHEGNYVKAKTKLNTAIKLGYMPDPTYEKDLDEKLNVKN